MGLDMAAAVGARTAVGAVGPVVAPMSLAAGTGVAATGTVEAGIMLALAGMAVAVTGMAAVAAGELAPR